VTSLIFFVPTRSGGVIISLTEGKPAYKVWAECHFWSFPFYMGGAAVCLRWVSSANRWMADFASGSALIYWVYRSYHLYLAKLATEKQQVEIEKRHAEEVAALTCAPSRAWRWPSKPRTTPRTSTYSGCAYSRSRWRKTGLRRERNRSLARRGAAPRHWKLAIPEHIINKPDA